MFDRERVAPQLLDIPLCAQLHRLCAHDGQAKAKVALQVRVDPHLFRQGFETRCRQLYGVFTWSRNGRGVGAVRVDAALEFGFGYDHCTKLKGLACTFIEGAARNGQRLRKEGEGKQKKGRKQPRNYLNHLVKIL